VVNKLIANKIFPCWTNADVTLRQLVKEHFKLYLRPTDSHILIMEFFNDEDFELIPTEDINAFLTIYHNFMNHVFNELNISFVSDKYMYSLMIDNLYAAIKNEIEELIYNYEETNKIKISEVFLYDYLGVSHIKGD